MAYNATVHESAYRKSYWLQGENHKGPETSVAETFPLFSPPTAPFSLSFYSSLAFPWIIHSFPIFPFFFFLIF